MSSRGRADGATVLSRALVRSAAAAGLRVEVVDPRTRPWSSATFTGERVKLTVRVEREAGAWLTGLPDADLPMRGRFVASLTVKEVGADTGTVEAVVLLDA